MCVPAAAQGIQQRAPSITIGGRRAGERLDPTDSGWLNTRDGLEAARAVAVANSMDRRDVYADRHYDAAPVNDWVLDQIQTNRALEPVEQNDPLSLLRALGYDAIARRTGG